MHTTEFLLIRHGESTWNVLGRWQGHGNPPLSPRGRAQALQVARALRTEGVAVLVSSDLERARETAAIAADSLDLPLQLEPRLRELDVGVWSGLTHSEIARRWPGELARLRSGDEDVACGGGESRRSLRVRALSALEELAARHRGARLAVVTHSGVVRTLMRDVRLANAEWCRARWGVLREATG
jgi:probable phosphoglycerate mutase